ncbi:BspA family leucine-rich repeat surface protein [Pararhodonellum marinum]|uniref:BspA family leucine-rich repeat surface protein n=1 Tax=Pararhodonellum marinum TaxID=2755358 RepID=UPI00188F5E6B|nr:BspA family leucine-rich repeat surface protein [Pararhodonellum marinum]
MKALWLHFLLLAVLLGLIFGCEPDPEPVLPNLFQPSENGITCKCETANPGEKGLFNGVEFEAVDNVLLRQRRDENADMSKLCTSLVRDMSQLFYNKNFNEELGTWDVSNVTNMSWMFASGWPNVNPFNQNIGNWDVSSVTDMHYMFNNSNFNQPIGEWDVSKVTDMSGMFSTNNANHKAPFNQDIGDWDVGSVINMNGMFYGSSSFNQPIGKWNVSKVTNMESMFAGYYLNNHPFNQPIGNWDVSNVTDMSFMFAESDFNQPIGDWKVSNVTYMIGMFFGSIFDQPIGNWDVSHVIEMWAMFGAWDDAIPETQFNQPIGEWDISHVTDMNSMFWHNEKFNQDLSRWCVEKFLIEPDQFSLGATAWVLPKPVWGTCPD